MSVAGESIELRDCPKCGGSNSIKLTCSGFNYQTSRVVKCAHCGAYFTVKVSCEIQGEAFRT